MSELSGYTVEKGDPDPRGWTVVEKAGRRVGRVADLLVDTESMKVRQLLIDRSGMGVPEADGSMFALDADEVDVNNDTHEVVARRYSAESFDRASGRVDPTGAGYGTPGAASGGRDRLTLAEEELQIGKREVSRGEAHVGKRVETSHVKEPVTKRREEVVVERRPVSEAVRGDEAFRTGDEVRIPLTEEELVVEKRPVVKEELIVGKRTVEDRQIVEEDLKREEVDVRTDRDRPSDERRGRRR
jgi:uncharacterized protein (TIGR02271 family)